MAYKINHCSKLNTEIIKTKLFMKIVEIKRSLTNFFIWQIVVNQRNSENCLVLLWLEISVSCFNLYEFHLSQLISRILRILIRLYCSMIIQYLALFKLEIRANDRPLIASWISTSSPFQTKQTSSLFMLLIIVQSKIVHDVNYLYNTKSMNIVTDWNLSSRLLKS